MHGSLRVELVRSSIQRSYWAIYLTRGSARIESSRLSDNDSPVLVGENLDIVDHSEFSNNRGNPLYGRGGTIRIDRSDFFGNTVPSRFVACTSFRITNSHFTGHTRRPETAERSASAATEASRRATFAAIVRWKGGRSSSRAQRAGWRFVP